MQRRGLARAAVHANMSSTPSAGKADGALNGERVEAGGSRGAAAAAATESSAAHATELLAAGRFMVACRVSRMRQKGEPPTLDEGSGARNEKKNTQKTQKQE